LSFGPFFPKKILGKFCRQLFSLSPSGKSSPQKIILIQINLLREREREREREIHGWSFNQFYITCVSLTQVFVKGINHWKLLKSLQCPDNNHCWIHSSYEVSLKSGIWDEGQIRILPWLQITTGHINMLQSVCHKEQRLTKSYIIGENKKHTHTHFLAQLISPQ
jgi:hypothetical protein